jgi:hypothetical protein
METALHGHDVNTAQLAEDKLARMAFHCGNGEVGNVLIGEFVSVRNF